MVAKVNNYLKVIILYRKGGFVSKLHANFDTGRLKKQTNIMLLANNWKCNKYNFKQRRWTPFRITYYCVYCWYIHYRDGRLKECE